MSIEIKKSQKPVKYEDAFKIYGKTIIRNRSKINLMI